MTSTYQAVHTFGGTATANKLDGYEEGLMDTCSFRHWMNMFQRHGSGKLCTQLGIMDYVMALPRHITEVGSDYSNSIGSAWVATYMLIKEQYVEISFIYRDC